MTREQRLDKVVREVTSVRYRPYMVSGDAHRLAAKFPDTIGIIQRLFRNSFKERKNS